MNSKSLWAIFYNNGALPTGGSYRCSVCVDYMYYNDDGTIQKIVQTKEGLKTYNFEK